ncbi:NAD(P)H-dependent oxidoreductase [Schumannella luteola]|uniref:FMN dependent NADH:quinone oxidoreductase n=1 Tax=Schumannella luteola TaxID=472059 RepID=A0A852YGA9_9MICO|nr:NAD(P)H-dependent oxidoreductase [Schumannella luteola]NYH00172.1 FMN-dependent NADH-azoreductase [Schumannella luteola]TPX04073.1 FMN-dependent NADH-azoreductase [Schumannella luteola]
MPQLLRLDSSADLTGSVSRALSDAFVAAWTSRGDDHTVVVRDLHRDPLPHFGDPDLHWAPELRPADAAPDPAAVALQEELIAELIAADVLLVGAPMYNYSLPSTLKVWIDNIHVPGTTTTFGEEPTQPVAGRPAVIVSSRGAVYDAGTPTAEWDHTVPPLRLVLGDALGMKVDVVTCALTLADTVPALEPLRERAHAERAAAEEQLRELALTL